MRFVFFVLLLMTLLSCSKEDPVQFYTSPFYYYSEDNSKILYNAKENDGPLTFFFRRGDYKEVTADVDNFSVLSRYYGKDASNVYYKYTAIENVDAESFIWDGYLSISKDKNHVYFPEPPTNANRLKVVKDADPETYQKVGLLHHDCLKWYQDKNHYFYNHIKVDSDKKTMTFEAVYLPFDKQYIFSVENDIVRKIKYTGQITVVDNHLIRDSLVYYFNAGCDSVTRKIPYKDPDRYKSYYAFDERIFRIDNSIYIRGLVFLAHIVDANTFEVLDYPYCKDKNHVYYGEKLIPDADPETFEVLSPKYAKDKNHVYDEGELLPDYTPDDFNEDSWGRFPTEKDYGKAPPRRSSRSWSDDDD